MTSDRGSITLVKPWQPALLLCLGLAGAVSLPAADRFGSIWIGRYALAPGSTLAVENIQGAVAVEGWDGSQVEVVATKKAWGWEDRLDDVRIIVQRGDHVLTFRTTYPAGLDEPVRVDYRIRVPRQLPGLRLRTLEGDIIARDVDGAVDARTLLGDIRQENVRGSVVAQALTGNISVSLSALPGVASPLMLNTVSGNVDLLLPPHANADLELSTVAGEIAGAYIFEASDVPGDSKKRVRVGRGGVRISARTVRGNIRVAEQDAIL